MFVRQMSLSATSMDAVEATVSLVAVNFLESGSITTFEPSALVDVRFSKCLLITPIGAKYVQESNYVPRVSPQ